MASKVLVKLPTMPFSQGKKPPTELVTLAERNGRAEKNERNEPSPPRQQTSNSSNVDRVVQLEQNIKFLQEQHQITLVALHQEVESLCQKNRDLQFQLVFSKGPTCVPSSPSSPEDNGTGFAKSKGSPVCVNVTPLQVELLEKDLQDTKAALQEAKTQNQYLSEIIEQQKKKLDTKEEERIERPEMREASIQAAGNLDPVRANMVTCLKVADAMVKDLHRQNEELRKQIATLSHRGNKPNPGNSNSNGGNGNGNSNGNSNNSNGQHHSRGSPTQEQHTSHKFPPLQSQSYWHRKVPRNGRSRHDRQQQDHHTESDSTSLPHLQNGTGNGATSGPGTGNAGSASVAGTAAAAGTGAATATGAGAATAAGNGKTDTVIFESPFYRSRGYRNYSRDDSNRKYKGQASQRERRDGDHHHYHHHHHHHQRRDYENRNPKDHQREPEGSKDADQSVAGKS